MPAPALQTPTVPSLRSPRPQTWPRPAPRYAVTDDAWTVCGVFLVAALVMGAGGCIWRACHPTMETLPPVIVEATALPAPASVPYPQNPGGFVPTGMPMPARAPFPPMAGQPVAWADLTLMLRAGLGDADIIDELRGKQLVVAIGPREAAILRELGAGGRLMAYLQSRPVYQTSAMTPSISTPAPVRPKPVMPMPVRAAQTPPLPTPVDYAARDRQIKNLQAQIDAIDERIRQIRNHPDDLLLGSYNGRGWQDGDESPQKKWLDQLDKQRNDLRRQKWQLEGR